MIAARNPIPITLNTLLYGLKDVLIPDPSLLGVQYYKVPQTFDLLFFYPQPIEGLGTMWGPPR